MGIQELIKKNILESIDNYSPNMSISKVVKFFERYDISFTKTMIQNYVRVGVLPDLEKKRYYQKKHLVILLLIYDLKNIFSLDELKVLLTPFFDSNDDYLELINKFNAAFNSALISESKNIPSDSGIYHKKFEELLLMSAKALAIKRLVQRDL